MTITRREFIQIGSAITLSSAIASAAVKPVLGLIGPLPEPYPVPDEAKKLYSKRVQFKMRGLGLPKMTEEGYNSVIDKMTPKAVELKNEGANGIVLFGTSLTFYKGRKFNEELIASARNATGLPTTSMSTAVVDGLNAVHAKRVAVATAYIDDVSNRLRNFLGEYGFEVVPQPELQKFCASVYAMASKADALLVSCGGLRTLKIIEPLEKICNVPVVTSTPHGLWAGARLLGVNSKVKGFGQVIAM
jgi:arylmalonate decarboxylase